AAALDKPLDAREQLVELDPAGAAGMLEAIGSAYLRLGDARKAHGVYERALAELQGLGDLAGVARTRANMGSAHHALGEHADALEDYTQAEAELRKLGNRLGIVQALGNRGVALEGLKRYDEALVVYEQALAEAIALENKAGDALEAMTRGNIGEVHHRKGDHGKAREYLEESVRQAHSAKRDPEKVAALTMLARLHLDTGNTAEAFDSADDALESMETMLLGLGQAQGATARAQHASVFGIGAVAALREENDPQLFRFLESGRAVALLDSLSRRGTSRRKVRARDPRVAQAQDALRAAQDAKRAAQRDHSQAGESGDAAKQQAAAKALAAAVNAEHEAFEALERALKSGKNYFRVEDLRRVRRGMPAKQALVLYGFFRDEKGLDDVVALVVRRKGEPRRVALGKASEIAALCEPLTGGVQPSILAKGVRGPMEGRKTAQDDWQAAVVRVREQVVAPLGLGPDDETVVVSPDGPLCYLPFALLFEQPVTMTPSGTTQLLLADEAEERGDGILALGDPVYADVSPIAREIYYAGAELTALAKTGPEVSEIGATEPLLGAAASEAGLKAALANDDDEPRRRRAVHFACHGMVNVERPMLSSLALSPDDAHDGFLTALEVSGMHIPADIAVLSACQTSRGEIKRGEGIVGLTRAFLHAGAPRVLCSLWNVDDAATKALMVKFYELWNPTPKALSEQGESKGHGSQGIGAAQALKEAQAYVRSKKQWAHPFYWAAWTLWGLPN
ncbi:MAG: CHAT domain-containing tetratricopeptide repeat protein, partial [Planctomycetota bacterium]|nr:CHAT domain-containing tetratricopeptide repeat protein [Planctomycetota bacterium]